MKLDIDFRGLERACKIMGAPKSNWESEFVIKKRQMIEFKQTLSSSGYEVEFKDIEIVHGGLLSYKGKQVVIYIKEKDAKPNRNLISGTLSKLKLKRPVKSTNKDPENLQRFHLFDCKTIDGMKSQGRYGRYFVTDRKDGKFILSTKGTYDIEEKLFVCINCLTKLNYKNYNNASPVREQEIRNSFDIKEFFKKYESKFKDEARKG